jgi:hypothetical protein
MQPSIKETWLNDSYRNSFVNMLTVAGFIHLLTNLEVRGAEHGHTGFHTLTRLYSKCLAEMMNGHPSYAPASYLRMVNCGQDRTTASKNTG